MDVMQTEPQEAPMDDAASLAEITSLVQARLVIEVAATGSHDTGIGRIDFVLIDLTCDPLANIVDRKNVDFAKPPKQVTETWTSSVAPTADLPYRVFFHVYDASGVNLVGYDRRDFTCQGVAPQRTHKEEK